MPLTQEQEDLEHEARMDQMALNIEKMRNDMRWESRKFALQMIATLALTIGATVAFMSYFEPRNVPSTPVASSSAPR